MKLTKSKVDKYNKLADKGKHITIDTSRYGTLVWEDGDYNRKALFASDNSGREHEVDFNDIVRVNEENEIVKSIKTKLKEIIRKELNELKPGESSYREYKKVHKILDNIRDELSALIKYGEDYSLFQDAKYASKTLKKAWRDIARIT